MAETLDCFVTAFLGVLNLDMGTYLQIFPLLSSVYSILQGLAIGLTAIVALSGLATFWFGSVDSSAVTDRPVAILLRSLMAGMMVYFGGHFLSLTADLGTIPYQMFLSMDGAPEEVGALSFAGSLLQGAATIAVAPTYAVKDVTVALIEFIIIVLIAINLFKLTLEVAERYLMVGLLVFTSPIIYPVMATKSTSRIMRNWVSMYCGALIMMSASVVFLKLVVNGLNNAAVAADSDSGAFLLRILLVLALCRIAQRVDNYLQQLGLNVASTGGSVLDDILSLGSLAAKAFNGGRKGSGSVLGSMAGYASHTPLGQGLRAASAGYASGMSAREAFSRGRRATAAAYRSTVWGNAPMAAQQAGEAMKRGQDGKAEKKTETNTEKAKNAAAIVRAEAGAFSDQLKADGIKGAAGGFVRSTVHALDPELTEKHFESKDRQVREEENSRRRAAKTDDKMPNVGSNTHNADFTNGKSAEEVHSTKQDRTPERAYERNNEMPEDNSQPVTPNKAPNGMPETPVNGPQTIRQNEHPDNAAGHGTTISAYGERYAHGSAELNEEEKARVRELRQSEQSEGPVPMVSRRQSEQSVAEHGVTDENGRLFHRESGGSEPVMSDAGTLAGLKTNAETGALEAPSYRTVAAGLAAVLAEKAESVPYVHDEHMHENGNSQEEIRYQQKLDTVCESTVRAVDALTALDTLQDTNYTLSGREKENGQKDYVLETAKTAFRGSTPADMDSSETRMTAIQTENRPDTKDASGATIPGGRAYTVEYSDRNSKRTVSYLDGAAYAALSESDQAQMRRFVAESGTVLWFRASDGNDKDIIAFGRGKDRKPSGYKGSGLKKKK